VLVRVERNRDRCLIGQVVENSFRRGRRRRRRIFNVPVWGGLAAWR